MKKMKEWLKRVIAFMLAVLIGISSIPGAALAGIQTEQQKYSVRLESCEHGAIRFVGSEEQILTYAIKESVCIVPEADSGYMLDSLSIIDGNGNEILSDRENGRYTFLMPEADVAVSAVFSQKEEADVSAAEIESPAEIEDSLEDTAGEHTVVLADAENGSVAFSGMEGQEHQFYAGDTISLVMSADRGFEPDTVSIVGTDGELIRQDLDGEIFSFDMPEEDITVTVGFKETGSKEGTMIEEYIAENINGTINQNENNPRKKAAHVDVDGIKSSDLTDTGHTVYVSYTLADKSMIGGQDMDTVLTANSGALMGIYEEVADVYEVAEDADYWVAFVDITKINKAAAVIGADFCDTDVDSPTDFSDVIKYDKSKGIIYIPRSLYYNEDNEERALGIRAQILYAFDFKDATTNVAVAIDNGNRHVEAYADNITLKAPTLDITLTIPVVKKKDADKVSLEDFRVYLNGSETALELSDRETETEAASAYYNSDTGELTIATTPFTLKAVRVEITRKGIFENITAFASVVSGYFIKAVNAAKYTLIDDADDVSALPKTKLTEIDIANLHAGQLYNDDDGYWYYGNDDLYDTSADWSGMSSAVEAIYRTYKYCYVLGTEGASITSSKVDEYNAYLYEKIVDADKNVTWNTLMKYTDGSNLGIAKPTTSGGKPTPYNLAKSYNFAMTPPHGKLVCIGGNKTTDATGKTITQDFGDTSQWNVTVITNNSKTTSDWRLRALAAHCAHAGSGNEEVKDNTWSKRNTYVRILYVDDDYNYMIIGVAGPSGKSSGGAAQSACAIYKVKLKPTNNPVSVSKECAKGYEEIVEDNSCYKLNARYGLYTSKADAEADTNSTDAGVYRIATFKLSENGKSNSVTKDVDGNPLSVGKTYYIKEIKAGTGYQLDTTVYSIKIEAGEENVLETEDIPVYATVAVEKKDADTSDGLPGSPMVSLADTQFRLNHYFGYETDLQEALADDYAKSWLIKTVKETGSDNAEHYVARPDNIHKVSGSAFYMDGNGNCILPLGTYTLQEMQTTPGLTKEDMYFQANGTNIPSENQCMLFNIKPSTDSNGIVSAKAVTSNGITLADTVTFGAYNHETVGNLYIEKCDSRDKEKLAGAKFQLIDALGNVVAPSSENSITGNIDRDGIIVVQDNGTAYVYNIPVGSYTLKEIYAPIGYSIKPTRNLTIEGGAMSVTVEDNSQVSAGVKIQKYDAETGKPDPQGGASFSGAKFRIVTLQNCKIGTNHYSSGDVVYDNLTLDANGYAQTSADALTEGKYRIEEVSAPIGYLVGGSVEFLIEKSDDGKIKDVTNGEVTDPVIRGGVKIKKVDKNTGKPEPQGNATLANAKFEIRNLSIKPVVVNDVEYGYNKTVYTLTTGEDGTAQTAPDLLPYGHYAVYEAEGGQPVGYLWDEKNYQEFDIEKNGEIVDLSGAPMKDPVIRGGVQIQKVDLNTKKSVPQGDATLEGAEFEIINLSGHAVYVNESLYNPEQVCARIVTDKNGMAQTASDLLPYGHYAVREAENGQPVGYLWNEKNYQEFDIEKDGEIVDLSGDPMEDSVIRGGVKVSKYDGESEENYPLGGADLEGTEIVIYNESENAVWVEEQLYEPGEIVYVMYTDENGYAETSGSLLPYGSYRLVEVAPPEGYLGSEEDDRGIYEQEIHIVHDGEIIDRTGYGDGMVDYVKRGDISIRKINSDTQKAMAGVSFRITSLTTDESHVFTTDANGYYSSASSYCLHSNNTNGGGAGDGLWFGIKEDGNNVDVDDSEGALPYDTYLIEELTGENNQGMVMYSDTVMISENDVAISLGNIENKEIAIGTTARDALSNTHYQVAEAGACIVDTVYYQNLIKNNTYTLKATLMDKSSGDPVLDEDGEPVTAEKSFTPSISSGSVDVEIVFDSSGLAGSDVVVFEELYEDEEKLAEHKEITDEGQTIYYPSIETLAADDKTGTNTAHAEREVTVVDTVSYENLQAGRTYTLTGTLMVKETGQAYKDADGNIVTASRFFIPEEPSGTVEISFVFNGVNAAGETLVAFEELSRGGVTYAVHTDIEDEGQTVYFPKIGTTAQAKETEGHIVMAGAPVTIIDTVAYENLHEGQEYLVSGILMDKDTGEALKVHGLPVVSETTFIPEESSGTVDMPFTFDGTGLDGTCIVVFETLQIGSITVASHEDLDDGEQTIYIPEIGTEAVDAMTEEHVALSVETVTIRDTVAYKNLQPGETYTVSGVLMDKETGKELLADGEPVTAGAEFTPDSPSGTVELFFTFDGLELAGKAVVAYETVCYEEQEVAVHADITDEGQTVYIPEIATTALDAGTKEHLSKATEKVTIVDTVVYKNLAPGREYTVVGTLMDKETGKAIEADGEAVTSRVAFTPAEPDGSVEITFSFDGSALAGQAVVAFEEIYLNGKKVAVHAELEDENQTVYIPRIGTTALDADTKSHESAADKNVTIVDTVVYKNLIPGKKYTVTGTLMDKKTGKELMVSGKTVTAKKSFKPEKADGSVEVRFSFDGSGLSGKSVVAFESLAYEDVEIAAHQDLNDKEQTVSFKETKNPGKTTTHLGKGPKTGDTNNIVLYVALMLAALGGVFLILRHLKKRQTDINEKE